MSSGGVRSMAKLKPLKQWICDSCGELIQKPEDGYVEWQDGKTKFRIIHHRGSSPRKPRSDCFYDPNLRGGDTALDSLLGDTGRVYLTSWLDAGKEITETPRRSVKDLREWVELFRRLQVPYFEEARLYFDRAVSDGRLDGANEIYFYLPERGLKDILDEYAREEG
jgi:hypothetical protein